MQWDKEAETAAAMLPVPPIMLPYARLHAEKATRHRGLDEVTVNVLKETEKAYAQFMGKEKTEQFKAYLAGTGSMPEILLRERVVPVAWQSGVVDRRNLRMTGQKRRDPLCVRDMLPHAKRERLDPEQQQKRVEG